MLRDLLALSKVELFLPRNVAAKEDSDLSKVELVRLPRNGFLSVTSRYVICRR